MAKVVLTPAKVKGIQYAGQTVVFPIIGEAKFSDEGTLEVDESKVDEFVAATFDSFGFYQKGADAPAGSAEAKSAEYAEFKEQLDALGSKELLELAKESGLVEKHGAQAIASMTDGRLRQVLLERIMEQAKAGEAVEVPEPAPKPAPVAPPVSEVPAPGEQPAVQDEQDFSSSEPEFTPPGQEE